MEYTTVFDIGNSPDSDLYSFYGRIILGIVILSVGVLTLRLKFKGRSNWKYGWYGPIFLTGWGLIWTLVHSVIAYSEYNKFQHILKIYTEKRYEISEGIVRVTHEQPATGHARGDIVEIGNSTLEIDYFVTAPTYHQTIAYGGALKNGIRARVYHVYGQLIRVDVFK